MRIIPPSIMEKINKQNQTIYENANPKMEVVVARPRSSIIDTNYFTVENIRTKEGLTDISVATRRQKAYGPPDGLFAIHLDNGIARTLYRAYPDKLGLKWQSQFDIGPAKAVATCFDGHWGRYRDYWQLITEEYPYIFWVENDGKLYKQKWNDESTKLLLAEGVNKVKASRGWKNVNITGLDVGIVVGYIKTDGKLYYRNYCEQEDGTYNWENERQIEEFTGTAVNLNMFLTNDYRTAFIIEDSLGKIYWYLSSRNWAGMALAQEKFSLKAKAVTNLVPLTYHDTYHRHIFELEVLGQSDLLFNRTDNTFRKIENVAITKLDEYNQEYEDWGFAIYFKLNYPLASYSSITVQDTETLGNYTIKEVEVIRERYEYKIIIDETINEFGFNGAMENLKVEIIGSNPAGLQYVDLFTEFTPINLVPPFLPLPEVEVIWNE